MGAPDPGSIPGLSEWAAFRDVQHVIWTALPPKFEGEEMVPTADAVVSYLRQLEGDCRTRAENYIRCAPRKIRTEYREKIEDDLQWIPKDSLS